MTVHLIDPQIFAELQANAGADFVAELVATFAEEAPQIIGELRAAQAESAAERFRRAAHSLKSNSHTFGATRLADMARTLELDGVAATAGAVQALAEEFERALAVLQAMAAGGIGADDAAAPAVRRPLPS